MFSGILPFLEGGSRVPTRAVGALSSFLGEMLLLPVPQEMRWRRIQFLNRVARRVSNNSYRSEAFVLRDGGGEEAAEVEKQVRVKFLGFFRVFYWQEVGQK
eukprot:GHVU01095644.1.p2 GENE.GHVU01095644.1~~GHVU01095644.1.p2  ORF type:complete len:101 (+),score=12.90 GHVU01095644.1:251-553(+)